MRWFVGTVLLFLVMSARAEIPPGETARCDTDLSPAQARSKPDRFSVRVGGLFVSRIKSGLQINSRELLLLGTYIDAENTLGMRDTQLVPRLNMSYHIEGNHLVSFGWFRFNRSASKVVLENLEMGDIVIPIGTEISSFINTEYYKLKYNYMFFSHPKVKLTIGVGLHVSKISTGMEATGLIDTKLSSRGTAPLPMLGGAMVYTFSPKWRFAVRLDELYMTYSDYEGSMLESNAVVEYQAFRKISFGFGITRFKLDVNLDNDRYYARLTNAYQGFSFYTGFRF